MKGRQREELAEMFISGVNIDIWCGVNIKIMCFNNLCITMSILQGKCIFILGNNF